MLRDQFDAEGERSVASVLRSGWSSRVVVAAWCLDACFHFSLAPREVKGRCYAFAARARRDPVAELARLLSPLRGASKARLFALDYFEMCSQTHLDLTFLAYLAYDMERLGVLQRHRHMEQETQGRPCCVVCLHEVSLPTIYEPCRHRCARLHQPAPCVASHASLTHPSVLPRPATSATTARRGGMRQASRPVRCAIASSRCASRSSTALAEVGLVATENACVCA